MTCAPRQRAGGAGTMSPGRSIPWRGPSMQPGGAPVRKEQLDGDDVFVIDDFFTPEECAAAIARSEASGFEEATITTAAGPVMNKGMRDNARALIDDVEEADRLFDRARPLLPAVVTRRWRLCGFNERWRYYRYDPGERFFLHFDGHYGRDNGEKSQLTFMAYLNDDFAGGETNFYTREQECYLSVRPVRGLALVFVHWRLHEGAAVLRGLEYVQRTDVMFRRLEGGT